MSSSMGGDPKKKPAAKPAPAPRTFRDAIASPGGPVTAGSSRFGTLMHSAYLDSLERIAGRPSVYQYGYAPGDVADGLDVSKSGTLGEYTRFATEKPRREIVADTVTLTPALMEKYPLGRAPATRDAPGTSPEYAVAHELGHRMRLNNELREGPNAPGSLRRAMDSTYDAQEDSSVAHQREMPNKYWATNRGEHQSEAFANSIQFLRETAGQPADPDVAARGAKIADRYERAVPGTRLMTQLLLAHPLYANHPLNLARRPQRAAADATAVAPVTPTPRVP